MASKEDVEIPGTPYGTDEIDVSFGYFHGAAAQHVLHVAMRDAPELSVVPDRTEVLILPGITVKEVLVVLASGRVGDDGSAIAIHTLL